MGELKIFTPKGEKPNDTPPKTPDSKIEIPDKDRLGVRQIKEKVLESKATDRDPNEPLTVYDLMNPLQEGLINRYDINALDKAREIKNANDEIIFLLLTLADVYETLHSRDEETS